MSQKLSSYSVCWYKIFKNYVRILIQTSDNEKKKIFFVFPSQVPESRTNNIIVLATGDDPHMVNNYRLLLFVERCWEQWMKKKKFIANLIIIYMVIIFADVYVYVVQKNNRKSFIHTKWYRGWIFLHLKVKLITKKWMFTHYSHILYILSSKAWFFQVSYSEKNGQTMHAYIHTFRDFNDFNDDSTTIRITLDHKLLILIQLN